MARHGEGPSEAQASGEVANEESEDDDGDWPTLFELDRKLSTLMGRIAPKAVRPSETRNAQ